MNRPLLNADITAGRGEPYGPSPAEARLAGLAIELATALIVFALTLATLFFWNRPVAEPPFEEVAVKLSAGNSVMVGRYEISYALWRQCYEEGACDVLPKPGRSDAQEGFPVTGINWLDAGMFVGWINARTQLDYRLPTLDEWREFAGVPSQETKRKLFDDPRLAWAADYGTRKAYSRKVRPSGHYGAALSGVADIDGNVWEWTASCVAVDPSHCPAYFAAGADHFAEIPIFLRDAYGGGCSAGAPPANLGLRLVRDI